MSHSAAFTLGQCIFGIWCKCHMVQIASAIFNPVLISNLSSYFGLSAMKCYFNSRCNNGMGCNRWKWASLSSPFSEVALVNKRIQWTMLVMLHLAQPFFSYSWGSLTNCWPRLLSHCIAVYSSLVERTAQPDGNINWFHFYSELSSHFCVCVPKFSPQKLVSIRWIHSNCLDVCAWLHVLWRWLCIAKIETEQQ